jgi:hypothetical protein
VLLLVVDDTGEVGLVGVLTGETMRALEMNQLEIRFVGNKWSGDLCPGVTERFEGGGFCDDELLVVLRDCQSSPATIVELADSVPICVAPTCAALKALRESVVKEEYPPLVGQAGSRKARSQSLTLRQVVCDGARPQTSR